MMKNPGMKHDETLSEKKWIEAETKGDNLQARKKNPAILVGTMIFTSQLKIDCSFNGSDSKHLQTIHHNPSTKWLGKLV